jgi:hypothetical protein
MRNGLRIWLPLLAASLLAGGCRRNDIIQNELRARDVQYREALEELMRTEAISEDLRRENEALRAGQKLSPETAAQTFGVRKIVIGRGTSGVDNDRVPGDEALQIWVEPRDASDHTMKAPGILRIAVQEISAEGEKTLLSTWDIDAERLRNSWKQGLLSIGYMIQLPWKTPPRVETIRVIARFVLPDGRFFEADRDLKIRLMPGAALRPPPARTEAPILESAPVALTVVPAGHWTAAAPAAKTAASPSRWQAPPLKDALQLGRPLPVFPSEPMELYRPAIGPIQLDD